MCFSSMICKPFFNFSFILRNIFFQLFIWNVALYRWKLHNGWKLKTNDGMVPMKSCTMDEKLKNNCNRTHFCTFSSSNLVGVFKSPLFVATHYLHGPQLAWGSYSRIVFFFHLFLRKNEKLGKESNFEPLGCKEMSKPLITFFWLKNWCKKDSSNINHSLGIIKRKFKNILLTRHCFTIASNLDYVAFNLLLFLMLTPTYPPTYILIIFPPIRMLTYPPTHLLKAPWTWWNFTWIPTMNYC
jgi:hypothetical protein